MTSIKKSFILAVLFLVSMIASIGTPTVRTMKMEHNIRSKVEMLKSDTLGQIQMAGVLGGITLTISGFATLVLGNYIIYAIMTSIPALNSSGYNATRDAISSYVGIVLPLFGLVMMVSGFALILMSLGVLNIINRQ